MLRILVKTDELDFEQALSSAQAKAENLLGAPGDRSICRRETVANGNGLRPAGAGIDYIQYRITEAGIEITDPK